MTTPNIWNKDLLAGLLFIGIALGFLAVGRDLEIGAALDMGPGYFPAVIAGLLALLGLAVTLGALKNRAGRSLPRFKWKPLAMVVGAPLIFAALVDFFGLAPALIAAVWFSTLASRPWHAWKSLGLSVLIAVFCWLVFALAFGMPIPFVKWPG
ncbi:tripartite tricarboxylate transporter TctB family protein [Propionivibrio sp.]|uniref:tripartite tricarboxylate transporter TctB family protein n=1 Tax=Propionivibrio sp. TaxID=2212460 RepID=UPI0039E48D1A